MALGSNSGGSPRIFLSVGFGKIRQKTLENKQKVDKDTPGAVLRKTQKGDESWALEHEYVSGTIENIFYKEGDFGNSFEVVIRDVADLYQLSFGDDSRFWFALMKVLPNVDLSKQVHINVYDFDGKDGKRVVGLTLKQNDVKILSHYEVNNDGKWTLLHGFPKSEGVNFKDKDELKIYFIQVKKFLKDEFYRIIAPRFSEHKDDILPDEVEEVADDFVDPDTGLPF